MLRGKAEHLAGSVAMPFMIGPGTVNASVIIGTKHNLLDASLESISKTSGFR